MTDPTKKPTLGNRGKTVIASPRVKPLACQAARAAARHREAVELPTEQGRASGGREREGNAGRATGCGHAVSGREGIRRRLTQGPERKPCLKHCSE